MTSPLPGNTSGTARLMVDAPSFAIGWQERIVKPNPAPGSVWAHKADGRFNERVLSITYTFTTSAVVANRSIVVNLIDNNGVVIAQVPGSFGLAAGSVTTDFFMRGAPAFHYSQVVNTYQFLPDFMMPPDWSWQPAVVGLDAGDAFTGIAVMVQRFPNDAASISAIG